MHYFCNQSGTRHHCVRLLVCINNYHMNAYLSPLPITFKTDSHRLCTQNRTLSPLQSLWYLKRAKYTLAQRYTVHPNKAEVFFALLSNSQVSVQRLDIAQLFRKLAQRVDLSSMNKQTWRKWSCSLVLVYYCFRRKSFWRIFKAFLNKNTTES